MSIRVLLFGYYGYGNFGDEILLTNSIKLLEETTDRNIDIYVLLPAGYKNLEKKRYKCVNRWNPLQIFISILKSNVLIGGGGGVFQDETSFKSFFYYSTIVLLALIFGKKIILLCHGIGPLKKKLSRWLMKKILSSELVFPILRDEVSYRYSKIISKNSYLGVDLSVLNPPKLSKEVKVKNEKVSFILKHIPNDFKLIMRTLKSSGISEIDLLVFFPNADYKMNKALEERLKNEFKVLMFMDHNDLVESIATSRFVLTERLHGAIISTLAGTKFIMNSRIKKMNRFFRDYPLGCDFDDVVNLMSVIDKMEKIDFNSYRNKKLAEWKERMENVRNELKRLLKIEGEESI